jgi:hypothetical protein
MSATAAQRAKLARRIATAPLKRATKYRSRPTTCTAGHRHPSAKESDRCGILRLLEKGGELEDLKFQPRYKLVVDGFPVCTYVADFSYIDARTRKFVVEDCKGVLTPVYRLKKKLMKACHGLEITET